MVDKKTISTTTEEVEGDKLKVVTLKKKDRRV